MRQQKYTPTVLANSQVSFVVLSDVWLDNPRTIPALKKLFEGYAQAVEYKPMAFILCGNFCQRGWEGEGGLKRYTSKSRHWERTRMDVDVHSWFQRLDRSSIIVPTPPIITFRICPRSTGSMVFDNPTASTYTYSHNGQAGSSYTQSPIRLESMSYQVFRAGSCGLQRGYNGQDG